MSERASMQTLASLSRTARLEAAWDPLARAMQDFHDGRLEAYIRVESDIWCPEDTSAASYYRPDSLPLDTLDLEALRLCRGRVLDIGAGAGRHAIELQRRGLSVVAIDISAAAVGLMRQRGVESARCADFFALRPDARGFETLLLMMHGVGFVGTLEGLGRFLDMAKAHMTAGAQILCDSADLLTSLDADELEEIEARRQQGSYLGEVEFRLEYRGVKGASYQWLFVDPTTLTQIADQHGYQCEVVARADRGAFLARLSKGLAPSRAQRR